MATVELASAVPDKAHVVSLVMPPLTMLATAAPVLLAPVSVPMVVLRVPAGAMVSTVPVMALVVAWLPCESVIFAVRLCAPSIKALVVYVQPVPVTVALPNKLAPS